MVQVRQDAPFDKDFFDTTLIYKSVQKHLFESVLRFRAFNPRVDLLLDAFVQELDFEYSSIRSIANLGAYSKVRSGQGPQLKRATFARLWTVSQFSLLGQSLANVD